MLGFAALSACLHMLRNHSKSGLPSPAGPFPWR
jgi:hypothetical protein